MSYKLRIILEYFPPKIGRRIRIFSLGRKNNILIKKEECTTFKVKNLFNVKDAVPDQGFRTRVVYKFSSASCNACYVGETSRHFSRPHLQSSESCRTSCTLDCFQVLDSAATKYQVHEAQRIYVHKMGETLPQPAGETHKPDSLPVSR